MVSSQQHQQWSSVVDLRVNGSTSRAFDDLPLCVSTTPFTADEATITAGFRQLGQAQEVRGLQSEGGRKRQDDFEPRFKSGGPVFIALAAVTLAFWTLAIYYASASLPMHLLNQPW